MITPIGTPVSGALRQGEARPRSATDASARVAGSWLACDSWDLSAGVHQLADLGLDPVRPELGR